MENQNTTIKYQDFFTITENLDKNTVLQMNEYTYKKIIGKVYGIKDFETITNVVLQINGIKINFDAEISNNSIYIKGNSSIERVEITVF